MMKKIFVTGCAVLLAVSLSGCGLFTSSDGSSKCRTPEDPQPASRPTESEQQTETPAQPPVVETQTPPEEKPSEAVNTDGLSDDLYSYQLMINGTLYQLPCDFNDLTANGWKLDEDENQELDAYTYVPGRTFKMGECGIEAGIVNLTDRPQPYSACRVIGITVDSLSNWHSDINVTLPKGIQYGKSTIEDVRKAYGNPTDEHENNGSTFFSYEESYAEKEIRLTFHDGILKGIEMKNKDY